jgi:hypothetical protein
LQGATLGQEFILGRATHHEAHLERGVYGTITIIEDLDGELGKRSGIAQ